MLSQSFKVNAERKGVTKQSINENTSNDEIKKLSKKLKGLFRIDSDLILITDMLNLVIDKEKDNHVHLDDYQGIVILYRKCFQVDKRGIFLEKEHLAGTTLKQKELQDQLFKLRNKHVAHSVITEYDEVQLSYVIDNKTQKAIDILFEQFLFEPLNCLDFQTLKDLIQIIRKNIYIEVTNIKKLILDDYNK